MKEREAAAPDSESNTTWQFDFIAGLLEACPESVRDTAFGAGVRLPLSNLEQADLQLYPAAGVARLTTRHAQVVLHRQAPPEVSGELVVFSHADEAEEMRLAITQDAIFLRINSPLESPSEASALSDGTTIQDNTGTSQLGPLERYQGDAGSTTSIQNQKVRDGRGKATDAEPQTRITITGRLGRNPHLRTTRGGTLVATFPVAIPQDDGSTSWHRVVAFNERAEKVGEQLKSGDRVEIIGYLHQRERRQRDGSTSTIEELYAAVIKVR